MENLRDTGCRPPATSQGFTLIELIITIAIAAILASLAMPSFTYTIRSNRVATASNDLLAAINQARGEAVTRARPVTICASNTAQTDCDADPAAWDNGWLVVCTSAAGVQQGCASSLAADTGILRVFPGVQPIAITSNRRVITFDRQGATTATADFDVIPEGCKNKQQRQVSITLLGRSRAIEKSCI